MQREGRLSQRHNFLSSAVPPLSSAGILRVGRAPVVEPTPLALLAMARHPHMRRQGPHNTCFDPELPHTQLVRLQDGQFQDGEPVAQVQLRLRRTHPASGFRRRVRCVGQARPDKHQSACGHVSTEDLLHFGILLEQAVHGQDEFLGVWRVLGQAVSCCGVHGEKYGSRHRDTGKCALT